MMENEKIRQCHLCSKHCPQAETANEIAKGRMYVTKELIACQKELEAYRAIGTVEECRTAVERMKAASTNESMVTVGLYFEIHDADLYGGKGTVGYASTNADSKVSALAKADIGNYVESQRQAFAEMLKVDVEKVKVISRTEYEENTEEEDECDFDWSE